MSLYEIMVCNREAGGCGHRRHRHTRAGGNQGIRMLGACRVDGSDGRCACPKFVERVEDKTECRAP